MACAIFAGGTHVDHVDVLRAGSIQRVLPFRVTAPSTIGTFLPAFTFGPVRRLDSAADRVLQQAWNLAVGPTDGEALVIDVDSTIAEVHEKQKRTRRGERRSSSDITRSSDPVPGHCPSVNYSANAAWLHCAVIAHNFRAGRGSSVIPMGRQ